MPSRRRPATPAAPATAVRLIDYKVSLGGRSATEVTRLVKKALAAARRIWEWSPPSPLPVAFESSRVRHSSFRFIPARDGAPPVPGHITLSYHVTRWADEASVVHTLVHELGHWLREMHHPRRGPVGHGHDATFCRLLKPARLPGTCVHTSVRPGPHAALRASQGTVQASHGPGGVLRLVWTPTRGRREDIMVDGGVHFFLQRFPRADLARLRVTTSGQAITGEDLTRAAGCAEALGVPAASASRKARPRAAAGARARRRA